MSIVLLFFNDELWVMEFVFLWIDSWEHGR